MADPFQIPDSGDDFEKLDPFSPNSADTMDPQGGVATGHSQPAVEDLLGGFGDQPISPPKVPEPEVKPQEPMFGFDKFESQLPAEPVPDPVKPSKPSTDAGASEPQKPNASPGTWLKNVDPKQSTTELVPPEVVDLIYWRDVKKTGIVFGSMMVLLLSLALFSVLSVVAYLSLATLTVTLTFCIYKKILQAVQKSGEGHPFKQYLDMDIVLPEDKVHQVADLVVKHAANTAQELRRLFLVQETVDSLKFGLLLWVLTYIGAWFNGMTLIILVVLTTFTLPKFYETNKEQIDKHLDTIKSQVSDVMKQVQEKIPFPTGSKKKEE